MNNDLKNSIYDISKESPQKFEYKKQYENQNIQQQQQQQQQQDEQSIKYNQILELCGKKFLNLLINLRIYMPYFNVTTKKVGQRLWMSLFPFYSNFFKMINIDPDLYGPFWIQTTLIFCLAASGNIYRYNNLGFTPYNFQYDFSFVIIAMELVYSFSIIIPLLVYAVFRGFGSKLGLIQHICIYGYSNSIYVIISLLMNYNSTLLHWAFLFYGIGHSSMFLIINYWNVLSEFDQKTQSVLMFGVVLSQTISLLIFKFTFFNIFNTQIIINNGGVISSGNTYGNSYFQKLMHEK